MKPSNVNRLIFLITFNVFISLTAKCQINKKGNPIIFAEIYVGQSWGKASGFSVGAGINYQNRCNLFTIRSLNTIKIRAGIISRFAPIFFFEERSNLDEWSLLYGRRFIDKGTAYSFSLGISHNYFRKSLQDNNNQIFTKTYYVGLPFEANVKWFKKEKQRFRIYGLIPVGKPTALGNSLGLKIFGNISKNSSFGLGVTYGLGYHKSY